MYGPPTAGTVDLHEFQLTPEGTALFTCTPPTRVRDLSPAGGPTSGQVIESVFQEVDVASGRLIREWKGLDHIGVDETYRTTFAPLDYLHVNSLDVLPDGKPADVGPQHLVRLQARPPDR